MLTNPVLIKTMYVVAFEENGHMIFLTSNGEYSAKLENAMLIEDIDYAVDTCVALEKVYKVAVSHEVLGVVE